MSLMVNFPSKFDIYGVVNSTIYQKTKILVEFLNNNNSGDKANINPMDPFEFSEYKIKLKKEGKICSDEQSIIIIRNDDELFSFNEFLRWMRKNSNFKDEFPEDRRLEFLAEKEQDDYLVELQKKHPLLYLDITIEDRPAGQFIIKLFQNKCPKTSKWFYNYFKKDSEISYNGVRFERLVHNGWIQSGEFQQDGVRIIDNIPIENFVIQHSTRGIVSLCNLGPPNPTENSSPFMIQFKENPFFNKKYVALGKLVFGYSLLDQIEKIPTTYEKPINEIRISKAGIWQSVNQSIKPPEYKEFIDEVKPEVLRNWFIKTNESIHYPKDYQEKLKQQKLQLEQDQQSNLEADSLIIEYL
ncbi:cyclophilin-like protein [Anaeromyces robustus]|uniref:peptidylprolyl isomerase n=1 Tax=Anaeromyces robustus TaxID=1754192 RepID=A0A1Y1X715_9FUNG|nr:cyclophilin-like protein [Anaeromyces robustus]|eukprot:ORX81560.1 cyclophilin-like protein [Anaeromyces robustus]